MSNKIVVAKPGYNALTETNPDNLIFSSDYNTLKYYLNGNTSIHIVGDDTDKITTTPIAHNLGYVPLFIVYVNFFTSAPNINEYSIVPHESDVGVRIRRAEAWADSTNLYLQLRNKSLNDDTAVFYYKIFRNNLGL